MQKEYQYCLRCGRILKKPENRLRGYGDVCFKKLMVDEPKKSLFDTFDIIFSDYLNKQDKNNEL